MFHTNFPRFVIILIGFSIGMTLNAQDKKEVVILYNTKPVMAQVTMDGSVLQILGENSDYLKGYTLQVPDYVKHLEEINKSKQDKTSVVATNSHSSSSLMNIPFEPGFATLSDQAILQLDEIINTLKKNANNKLVLRTLSKANPSNLDQNRINSIKAYFNIRGLKPEIITYEAMVGQVNLNEVLITISSH